jgi:hypothetical protein
MLWNETGVQSSAAVAWSGQRGDDPIFDKTRRFWTQRLPGIRIERNITQLSKSYVDVCSLLRNVTGLRLALLCYRQPQRR